jgi:AAA ATPase domain/Adenylate and Guanylate cyclase catalytic domain
MQRCVREQVADFGGLELRVGVNTGEMMFAPVGPQGRREPTVHGDAVNTASRLETAAPVGGVLVGEKTYTATRESFAYERVPPLRVKGKAAPVAAWVAVEPLGAPAKRVLSVVPMVGRDVELDLVSRLWERTLTQRRPHLTTIHGPAGIGKTRLVDELLRRIVAGDAATAVYSGRCLPYGQGITYWPLREILWAAAGIPLDDTAAAAAERLRRLVARLAAGGRLDAAEAERLPQHCCYPCEGARRPRVALCASCGTPPPDASATDSQCRSPMRAALSATSGKRVAPRRSGRRRRAGARSCVGRGGGVHRGGRARSLTSALRSSGPDIALADRPRHQPFASRRRRLLHVS